MAATKRTNHADLIDHAANRLMARAVAVPGMPSDRWEARVTPGDFIRVGHYDSQGRCAKGADLDMENHSVAKYIALVDPAVGMSLAGLLRYHVEFGGDDACAEAVAVARAILREDG